MLLGQLSLALVTAVVYFGDPRFRVPFDVFGLALAASLIADRVAPPGPIPATDPGVGGHLAPEQHDDSTLSEIEPALQNDRYEARSANADGEPAVRVDDTPEEVRWHEARSRADEDLGVMIRTAGHPDETREDEDPTPVEER